jgi:hypothetical protein
MGAIKTEDEGSSVDDGGESKLRGRGLDGSERDAAADHTADAKKRNTDTTLRLDGEEDTLYEDGLEVEDGSGPLTGKDGRDDTDNTGG